MLQRVLVMWLRCRPLVRFRLRTPRLLKTRRISTCQVCFQLLHVNFIFFVLDKNFLSIQFLLIIDLQSIFLVQNLSYSIENRNQILLTWNSTELYHDCVYDYVVSIPTYVNLPWITTRETHLVLSNLNACAKYRVTVTARNLYKEFVGRSTDILVQTNTLGTV